MRDKCASSFCLALIGNEKKGFIIITPVDAEASVLQSAVGQPDDEVADAQVARALSLDHFSLPSHPRDQEDGNNEVPMPQNFFVFVTNKEAA